MKLTLFRYFLIFTSLLVIFFAAKYAIANLSYLKVDSYLERWQVNKEVKQAELDDALESTNSMLSLHGHFPHYLNVAAKVYEWQAYAFSSDRSIHQSSLQQALSYYQKSTQLREHWPLTWVFMANVKANLKEFDDDFYFYLEQGIKYGPFAYEVNLQVAKLQLLYWGNLPELPTKVGLEQIKRALLNNRSRVALLNYARDIDRLSLVCTVAKLDKIERVLQHHLCR